MTYNERIERLEAVLPLLAKESFIYKSPSDRVKGCDTLLAWFVHRTSELTDSDTSN